MAYECRIERDSISPHGRRLTTMVVTYPRFVHCEMMTHRQFSRNASSSRAIPVERMIQKVRDDPVYPVFWGKNQKGMQAQEELKCIEKHDAISRWDWALNDALNHAQALTNVGAHKQIVNRLLEPFSWITVIISSTEWSNFFGLRCHPDAQPEIRKIAEMMREEYVRSAPVLMKQGQWHLPFITSEDEAPIDMLKAVSAARCARVSYLTQDGKRDMQQDFMLHQRLIDSGHWSPLEHVARPYENSDMPHTYDEFVDSNFRGWHQYRKDFANECR